MFLGGREVDKFKPRDVLALAGAVFVCQVAGIVGSIFTIPAIPAWYGSLRKPSFTPPSWIFAPVWVTLFTLMGISLFIILRKGFEKPAIRKAVSLFGAQLVLNMLWSIAFFGLRSPLYGLFVIVLLLAAVLATIAVFYTISRTATILLIPYFLWGTFASVLNYSILVLNP
jgi:benzodiazapine receptor